MRAGDVYESREAADRLVQDSIGPIAADLGLPMPDISEFEVRKPAHALSEAAARLVYESVAASVCLLCRRRASKARWRRVAAQGTPLRAASEQVV